VICAWALGVVMGAGIGAPFGAWLQLLALSDPIRAVGRAYREVWRDVDHLLRTGRLRPGR